MLNIKLGSRVVVDGSVGEVVAYAHDGKITDQGKLPFADPKPPTHGSHAFIEFNYGWLWISYYDLLPKPGDAVYINLSGSYLGLNTNTPVSILTEVHDVIVRASKANTSVFICYSHGEFSGKQDIDGVTPKELMTISGYVKINKGGVHRYFNSNTGRYEDCIHDIYATVEEKSKMPPQIPLAPVTWSKFLNQYIEIFSSGESVGYAIKLIYADELGEQYLDKFVPATGDVIGKDSIDDIDLFRVSEDAHAFAEFADISSEFDGGHDMIYEVVEILESANGERFEADSLASNEIPF